MLFKKNIWLIYYVLLAIGLAYLLYVVYSDWLNIQRKTKSELAYINTLFSSSISLNFDQQEIMLELMGQQLFKNRQYRFKHETAEILDDILQRNQSLVGFGVIKTDGEFAAGSSNVDAAKMPNLRQHQSSKESFEQTLANNRLTLGRTYFVEALDSWVIPIRKAIRNKDDETLGVMAAGIKPSALLPRLEQLNQGNGGPPYQAILIHASSNYYSYISGILDTETIKQRLTQPVADTIIDQHLQEIERQLGLTEADLKSAQSSAEYIALSPEKEMNFYSLLYIPKYDLWALIRINRSYLVDQLVNSLSLEAFSFIVVFIIIFFLFRYIERFEQSNRERLLSQVNHDFLTGLNNRYYLQHIEPEWTKQESRSFSVLFIDLDNFKNINDSYGHTFGDEILKQVSIRLRSIFSDKDLICRQGGDEFIVLSKTIDREEIEKLAENTLNIIDQPYLVDQYEFSIGASIGICFFPQNGKTFNELFSAADTAMYKAKLKKNHYMIFTLDLHEEMLQKAGIEQALHSALDNGELSIMYQPQIGQHGLAYGIEALVRWNNPELGFIPPNLFIPVAEDNGSIINIGHYVIDKSFKDVSNLMQKMDNYDIQLSINISIRQLQESGFIDKLSTALKNYKFPSKQLTLEITESIFIEDYDYLKPVLDEIRTLGIKISMDDFGTGYSSLSMLKNLPIDEVKIDKSFIDNITIDNQDKMMVMNIINIAHNLGKHVVVEGVELKEQSELLREYDCDIQQGYYFSKPMYFDELLEFCQKHQ